eukprot:scaffold2793_cov144-Pinguiococcus_pyrenoidosus.AAC.2
MVAAGRSSWLISCRCSASADPSDPQIPNSALHCPIAASPPLCKSILSRRSTPADGTGNALSSNCHSLFGLFQLRTRNRLDGLQLLASAAGSSVHFFMRCPVVIGTSSSSLASNAQLQEFCCGSVMDMARSMDILREQLASLKAGDAVVAAMKTHRDVAGVQARGN